MHSSTRSLFVALVFMAGCPTLHTRPHTTPGPVQNAPDFTLTSHTGASVSLTALRAEGPVVVVFYRGYW